MNECGYVRFQIYNAHRLICLIRVSFVMKYNYYTFDIKFMCAYRLVCKRVCVVYGVNYTIYVLVSRLFTVDLPQMLNFNKLA